MVAVAVEINAAGKRAERIAGAVAFLGADAWNVVVNLALEVFERRPVLADKVVVDDYLVEEVPLSAVGEGAYAAGKNIPTRGCTSRLPLRP